MGYYPLFLDLRKRRCLVVGGGGVGTRKAGSLVRCGAEVTVISHEFSRELVEMGKSGNPLLVSKDYETSDLDGMFLVFAATDKRALNEKIGRDSEERGKLYSLADDPDGSCFITPSVIQRGDLTFAISTTGKSPALARKIRQDIESLYGPEYGVFLRIMGDVRKQILDLGHDPDSHARLFRQVIDRDVPAMIRDGRDNEVKDLFRDIFKIDFDDGIFTGLKD